MKNSFGQDVGGFGAFGTGIGDEGSSAAPWTDGAPRASFSGAPSWAAFGSDACASAVADAAAMNAARGFSQLAGQQSAMFGAQVVFHAPASAAGLVGMPAPDAAAPAPLLDVKAPTTWWGRFSAWVASELMPDVLKPH